MTTELIPAQPELCEDPRFAVCHGRGSVMRRTGNFLKVEKGARTIVHRVLCVVQVYGERCRCCPNSEVPIQLRVP